MECYYFSYQYKDYFKTTRAKGHKRISFRAFSSKIMSFFVRNNTKTISNMIKSHSQNEMSLKRFFKKNLGKSTAFVNNIQSKIKSDSKYQLKVVKNKAAYFKYLKQILREFDADYILSKVFLGQYCYESLKLLIKLQIDENGQQLFAWNDFFKILSRAKLIVKIRSNDDLDKYYYQDKYLLKLIKEAPNNQPEKVKKSVVPC